MGTECPDCGTRLRRGVCPDCGWKGSVVEGKAHDPDAGRCLWRTNGLRCAMRGTYRVSVTGGKDAYCSWHAECLKNAKLVSDREHFTRFLSFLREGRYCTVWTHFDHSILWDAVAGTEYGEKPQPCLNPSCSVRLDMEREAETLLPAPPVPDRPLAHLLGRRLSPDVPTGERSAEDRARLETERIRQLEALKRMVEGC